MATTNSIQWTASSLLLEGGGSKGCLMAVLSPSDGMQIRSWAIEHIDEDNLAKDGMEACPHVTVLYGFLPGVKAKAIGKACREAVDHVDFRLGKITRFDNPEFDVLKVDVESEDLKELHYHLRKAFADQIEVTYPDYHAHLTLAYVKKGTHKELDGHDKFNGNLYRLTTLQFSDPNAKTKKWVNLDKVDEGSRFQLLTHLSHNLA